MNYGAKFAKPGYKVDEEITEQTKKNYVILNTTDAHKMIYAGYVTGGSYEHNLQYEPMFDAFSVDSVTNPTIFTATKNPRATTTHITNLPDPAYLMLYHEGNTP